MDRAGEVCDLLVKAAVLRRSKRLEFLHPIVREAVYADLGPRERAAEHAHAARVLVAAGTRAERVAAQLLATVPQGDPWIVEQLRDAAGRALAKGAPEVAARSLRRALAEPPGPPHKLTLLLELATAELTRGSPQEAIAPLERALELSPDGASMAVCAPMRLLGGKYRCRDSKT